MNSMIGVCISLKWSMPIRNWGKVYGELSIMYEGRL